MKKLYAVVSALALMAAVAPASAARAEEQALQLGISGYIAAYLVHTDEDEPGGVEYRKLDLRKTTEVDLTGEVALENGVTAGAEIAMLNDRNDDSEVDRSMLYVSGAYGRVNVGEEDGAAALMQVTAPSADEEFDGVSPDFGTFQAATGGTIEYAQDDSGSTNKLTYITPQFNGLQAGVSYTPSPSEGDLDGTDASAAANSVGTDLEDAYEVAVRYEGTFDAVSLAAGGGYSHASQEDEAAGEDDLETWNLGANFGWNDFLMGVSYLTTNNATANDGDIDTIVAGVSYAFDAYTIGLSYLNQKTENGAGTPDAEIDRWTAGGTYEWGPGMTFRANVQHQSAEDVGGVATADSDATAIAAGTMVNF